MVSLVKNCLSFCHSFVLKKTLCELPKLASSYALLELFNKCISKADAQCPNHTVLDLNGRVYEWVTHIQPSYLFGRQSFNSCIEAMCPDLQTMMSKFGEWAYLTRNNRTLEAANLAFYNFTSNANQLSLSILHNSGEMLEVFSQYCSNYSCVSEDLAILEGQWKECADPDVSKEKVRAIIALCGFVALLSFPVVCLHFCCKDLQPHDSTARLQRC